MQLIIIINKVYFCHMEKVQVVILAAGKGTRMESDHPKALAILQGKPFLEHILNTLSKINFPIKPVVVVGYKKEQIIDFFGPNINYAYQNEQLGTGHALLSAKGSVSPDHTVIFVVSADQPLISEETIKTILTAHKNENSVVTMGTVILPDFNEWRAGAYFLGRIMRNTNGDVVKIIEHKDANEKERQIMEINPALYVFDATWLWNNIDSLKNINSQGEYYITDLIKMAQEQNKKITAVPVSNIMEIFQPNSQAELAVLENILNNK